jgi:predicted membrane metal-binding protein
MKGRPLIAVALLYICGILLAGLPIPLFPLFILSFALLFLFAIWVNARRALLCALIVLTGWINLAHRTAILAPDDLQTSFGDAHELVTIRGLLRETPYHRVHEKKGEEAWSSMAQIEVSEFCIDKKVWQPASGCVMASVVGMLPDEYFAGRAVEVKGTLEPARGPVAEGLFDYRKYLEEQGIYYQLRAKKIEDWQITSAPATPLLDDRVCAWARKTLALGLPVEDEPLRLEWALTLGWKAALTEENSEPFMRAAT